MGKKAVVHMHNEYYSAIKKSTNNNDGEGVEKREPSYIVGGNANKYRHYGERYGDSLKNWK